jgi:hypothetical protein
MRFLNSGHIVEALTKILPPSRPPPSWLGLFS